jgi:hypothetical protein
MYFYLATSVRVMLYSHGIGVRVGSNRSAWGFFFVQVYPMDSNFFLKISTKIDERSGMHSDSHSHTDLWDLKQIVDNGILRYQLCECLVKIIVTLMADI